MTILVISLVISVGCLIGLIVHGIVHRDLYDPSRAQAAGRSAAEALRNLSLSQSAASAALRDAANHFAAK